jgi:CRP-like cAMP-binding protein
LEHIRRLPFIVAFAASWHRFAFDFDSDQQASRLPAFDNEQECLMLMGVVDSLPVANKLLAMLPRAEYRRMRPDIESIVLTFGDVLYEPGQAIRHVYFPEDALVSLLTLVDRDSALEVAMVGQEGMVDVTLALGIGLSAFRAIVQATGTAMRIKASSFRKFLQGSPSLQRGVTFYAHTLIAQIAQTAACNRFHVVEARLARRLLMTRDQARSDHFHLTHDFLAHMLGVRRVGITNAAFALKQRKLIDYSRGHISIVDGRGLEAAACSCYLKIKDRQKVWRPGV